jgi:hypothetical protein
MGINVSLSKVCTPGQDLILELSLADPHHPGHFEVKLSADADPRAFGLQRGAKELDPAHSHVILVAGHAIWILRDADVREGDVQVQVSVTEVAPGQRHGADTSAVV